MTDTMAQKAAKEVMGTILQIDCHAKEPYVRRIIQRAIDQATREVRNKALEDAAMLVFQEREQVFESKVYEYRWGAGLLGVAADKIRSLKDSSIGKEVEG